MADLSVNYMGLNLRNPIIAASSGLTNSVDDILEFEKKGAAAVVIKSIFEEEIRRELEKDLTSMNMESFLYPETMDYYDNYADDDSLTNHLKLIREAKKAVKIPIIASINCVTAEKWPYYAQTLQDAGADALELNVFVLPSDFNKTSAENEQVYFDIVQEVKKHVKIPIALKISYYSASLGAFIQKLSNTEIDSIVLFNRFYSPDIDINNLDVLSSNVLSHPEELPISLRWIAIMSERVGCDLAASTGIHDGAAVIKQLLAGANAVQIASAFYKNGKGIIENMLDDLSSWMEQKKFAKIDDFRGKLSQEKSQNPAAYERVQFMKYFSGKGL
ncbi:MAG TPA: dihydroorotate dehydrogenase-like protein [Bacteroidales bacterium]|nr:dihydroorotate dehydrogenase-like protein [Bacteroidales bacterium]